MFSIDKSDYILTNLTKVISYECSRKGFQFDDEQIKYLIVHEISNPAGNFTGANNKLDDELNRLADICVEFLCNSPPNVIKALHAETKFRRGYDNREAVLKKYRDLISSHTFPLIDDICRNEPMSEEGKDDLYRKIILATVLLSGLGDPSKISVYGNAEAALKSVFPTKNIQHFTMLPYKEKLKELEELKRLVTGIRLYNQTRNKGKDETVDLAKLIEDASEVVINKLVPLLSDLDTICKAFEILLCESVHFDEVKKSFFIVETSAQFDENMLEDTKAYLLVVQQAKIYFRKLLNDALKSQVEFYKLENTIGTALLHLTGSLKGKLAIPMGKVYGKFQLIGKSWSNLQEMSVVFNAINDAYVNVITTAQIDKLPESLHELVSLEKGEQVCLSELAARFSKYTQDLPVTEFCFHHTDDLKNCEIVRGSEISVNDLEFNGLCPVFAVESEGFLMDAKTELGILKYCGKYYGFKDKMAAIIFSRDPEKYMKKVLDFARQNIQYVEVLGLKETIQEMRGMKLKFSKVKPMKPVRNKMVQTEDHPIETFIDYKYSWNIWDYKRQAVQLANIENCVTHSTQTNASHFRSPAEAQTYSPREKTSNTVQEALTKMPESSVYMWGLRGTTRDNAQAQIKLQVPSMGLDHCLPTVHTLCPTPLPGEACFKKKCIQDPSEDVN